MQNFWYKRNNNPFINLCGPTLLMNIIFLISRSSFVKAAVFSLGLNKRSIITLLYSFEKAVYPKSFS